MSVQMPLCYMRAHNQERMGQSSSHMTLRSFNTHGNMDCFSHGTIWMIFVSTRYLTAPQFVFIYVFKKKLLSHIIETH